MYHTKSQWLFLFNNNKWIKFWGVICGLQLYLYERISENKESMLCPELMYDLRKYNIYKNDTYVVLDNTTQLIKIKGVKKSETIKFYQLLVVTSKYKIKCRK